MAVLSLTSVARRISPGASPNLPQRHDQLRSIGSVLPPPLGLRRNTSFDSPLEPSECATASG